MAIDARAVITIVFFVALASYVFAKRREMQVHKVVPPLLFFSMYRTTWGLKAMDRWAAKHGKLLTRLGTAGIVAGFLGMGFICYALVKSLFSLFAVPEAPAGVGLVLPFKAKGIFYVPIEYWVICIFIIALVHEFAHGVIARAHGIKVKSSGFAFAGTTFKALGIILLLIGLWNNVRHPGASFSILSSSGTLVLMGIALIIVSFFVNTIAPIIPAAFVEPDEKALRKRPLRLQLAVLGAGPFSNVIVGLLALGLLWPAALVGADMVEANGVEITNFVDGNFPAKQAGITEGEIVEEVDGVPTPYLENLSRELQKRKPGDSVQLKTDKGQYTLTLAKNPDNETSPYVGAFLSQSSHIKPGIRERLWVLPDVLLWMSGLLLFLFILNLGIGLFNLVPIGPLDGGRMLHAVLMAYVEKDKAMQLFSMIGLVFVIVVLMNILFPFVKPLF